MYIYIYIYVIIYIYIIYIYVILYTYIYSYTYLPSLPDLLGVPQFKQTSPGLTILVCFFPVSTETVFFLCLCLNGYGVSVTSHCQLQFLAHFLKP